MSVSLSVYLKKPYVQMSLNLLYVVPVVMAQSSSDNSAISLVLPVLWITSCFQIMGAYRDITLPSQFNLVHQRAPAVYMFSVKRL